MPTWCDAVHLCPSAQIDRLYGWKSAADCPVRDAFKRQKDFVMKEFEQRSEQVFLQLNEQVGRLYQLIVYVALHNPLCCAVMGACLCIQD